MNKLILDIWEKTIIKYEVRFMAIKLNFYAKILIRHPKYLRGEIYG